MTGFLIATSATIGLIMCGYGYFNGLKWYYLVGAFIYWLSLFLIWGH